jgi:shikimate dehydrogenase
MDEIEVVVNTTSVGMAQNLGQTPLAPSLLAPHQLVIDIIYNPEKTQLLKAAEQIGCRVQNGVGMLVWQAVKAWEFWWGITPPAEIMYQAVKASLS